MDENVKIRFTEHVEATSPQMLLQQLETAFKDPKCKATCLSKGEIEIVMAALKIYTLAVRDYGVPKC